MATYLDTIVAAHRSRAAADLRSLDQVIEAAAAGPEPRPFAAALADEPGLSLVAEVKRRSPSRGPLALDLDPAHLALSYEAGGASALSVLTDREFFAGSPADLIEARAACSLPVLRKDFTVDERDVADARAMGADAVLLIAAVLSDEELARFSTRAEVLRMDVLFEVHDETELDRVLRIGAKLVGVNQRDLVTFAVDRQRASALAPLIPEGVTSVAESGVTGAEDAQALAAAGYDAVLVGETLVTSPDPQAEASTLVANSRTDQPSCS